MNMQTGRRLDDARDAMWSRATGAREEPLVVGLVNNMSDAAVHATERHFCNLLSAASRDMLVRLKLYSPPEVPRSPAMRAHIDRYYDDFSELADAPPDGLIVTGAEPKAALMEDEPHWPALSRLADLARDRCIPAVWSCLAAHAAVERLDGVVRRPLGRKLSGLYDCRIASEEHDILTGTPGRWRVPHSRMYGLSEDELSSKDYRILSWSPETGPDVFIKSGPAVSVFFQGHPEYGAGALIGEYRRDVGRYLAGERDTCPDPPHGCFSASLQAQLSAFQERAARARTRELLPELAGLLAEASPQSPWSTTAVRIYANWLVHLDERRRRRLGVFMNSKAQAGEIRRMVQVGR